MLQYSTNRVDRVAGTRIRALPVRGGYGRARVFALVAAGETSEGYITVQDITAGGGHENHISGKVVIGSLEASEEPFFIYDPIGEYEIDCF